MPSHLERELINIKEKLLALSAIVEERFFDAIRALDNGDQELAITIIEGDNEIDLEEVEIEECCLKTLALYQPVAIDLRVLVAYLKINNDLERIGDIAGNIASRALAISKLPTTKEKYDFSSMALMTKELFHKSIASILDFDSSLAREVCASDSRIDELNKKAFKEIQSLMKRYPEEIETWLHKLSISRHLERIADHATNIAEDVIYLIDGEIVRHKYSPPV